MLSLSLFHEEEEKEEEEEEEDVMMMKSINNFYFMPTSLEEGIKKKARKPIVGVGPTQRFYTPKKHTQKFSLSLPPQTKDREQKAFGDAHLSERNEYDEERMIPHSSPSLLSFSSSAFISAPPPPRGGRNVSSSSNNNRNATTKRRSTGKKWSFTAEAGRRGKVKEGLSSAQADKVKIPIVGVEVPKPKLPAKVDAMVSGNERTIGIVLASLAIVKMRFGGRNYKRGSMGRLEERGMLDENREVDEEKFFKGMMKTVRTVDMPELTEQQIMAARERRRASRAGDANLAKELETVEIPANHPFASNEKLDAAQEAERKKKIIEANAPRRRTRPAPPKQK